MKLCLTIKNSMTSLKRGKMKIVTYFDINQKALEKWGNELQIGMVIEECLELATVLHKLRRTDKDPELLTENIIDEIADVTIMIHQARMMFGAEKVDKKIAFKMERLKTKLGIE